MSQTIQDDVTREVSRCIAENSILRISPLATRITADHRDTAFSVNAVASMLLEAGISAAIPIEIQTPEPAAKSGGPA